MSLRPCHWLQAIALFSTIAFAASSPGACPLLGPTYPAPTSLSSSPIIQSALQNLTNAIDLLTSTGNSTSGPYPAANITTWSLGLFSTTDNSSDPFWQYHYTAPPVQNSTDGVKKVDLDSVYRIGSITKLFTVYSLLVEAGDRYWQESVTKYVPELANISTADSPEGIEDVTRIRWEDVTLGDLANQLAGLPRDYNTDYSLLLASLGTSDPTQLGLPPLSSSEVPICSQNATSCNREEFFAFYAKRYPVFLPATTPSYSNDAFGILAYAIEGLTNLSVSSILQSRIFDPLNMTRSNLSTAPPTNQGVIPYNITAAGWLEQLGQSAAAGTMYSSLRDMVIAGRSILNSTLLSPLTTRRWLKPGAHTSSLHGSVGKPWEILRRGLDGRSIDLYTKAGNLGSYGAVLALLPDYDFGFQLLGAAPAVAGVNPSGGVTPNVFADIVAATVFPALEQVAKEQATAKFAGTYSAKAEGLNSSIVLAADDLPGLNIVQWMSNGTSFLSATAAGSVGNSTDTGTGIGIGSSSGQSSATTTTTTTTSSSTPELEFRTYPSNTRSSASNGMSYAAWNILLTSLGPDSSEGWFSPPCVENWVAVDLIEYGEKPITQLVFEMDKRGEVKAVINEGLRVRMEKMN